MHVGSQSEECLRSHIIVARTEGEGDRYRRAVRKKANLEVTGDEKPKMRLRRRKANKRPCREKSQFTPSRRRKASFTCLRRKKSQFAPSLDEKSQLPTFRARKKFNSVSENTFIRARIDK